MSTEPLRILIAEDSSVVREALELLIAHEPQFALVGAAANATDAIRIAATEQPDVALVDVRMPGGGGKAAAEGMRLVAPACKVIALSQHDDSATVREMLRAGITGYLVKGCPNREIIEAVKNAAEGRGSLSGVVTADIVRTVSKQLRLKSKTSRDRRATTARVQKALLDDRAFRMVFQPISELRKHKTVGVEALARFAGPPKRTPDAWFAEASNAGLGVELEVAAIRKAVASLGLLPKAAYLSVNVSPDTLASRRFHDVVTDVGGARLVAEVTEHALVQNYERVTGAVTQLRALGMRIAVDDAGAGFASLRHILNMSPELIKLDLSLVRDIDQDRSKQALATALIAFSKASGSAIIAEGIETASELKTLVKLGVRYGQGFLLGRPADLPPTGVAHSGARSRATWLAASPSEASSL